ncbi:MAG: phosphatase PAP2 family protein [bacterium]
MDFKIQERFTLAIVYCSSLVFIVVFLALGIIGQKVSGKNIFESFNFYFRTVSDSFIPFVGVLLLLVVLTMAVRVGIFLVRVLLSSFQKESELLALVSRENLRRHGAAIANEGKNILRIGIPLVIGLLFFSLALDRLNIVNANRLQDDLLMRWDKLLTGFYPFIVLANIPYPSWFIEAVRISFNQLASLLIVVVFYLYYIRRDIFYELVATFFISAIIGFALWTLVPALSPHDRYIDNVYQLPISVEIKNALTTYHPDQTINEFLHHMREQKERLVEVLPTSTMPSAHVMWAVFIVYYLYKANWKLGVAASPIAILSSYGTVTLAQHYFMDIPAGIIVAVFTIWLAHWLLRAPFQQPITSNQVAN